LPCLPTIIIQKSNPANSDPGKGRIWEPGSRVEREGDAFALLFGVRRPVRLGPSPLSRVRSITPRIERVFSLHNRRSFSDSADSQSGEGIAALQIQFADS